MTEWMTDVSWPRPDLAEFHMKLIAAAQGALADPIASSTRNVATCFAACEKWARGDGRGKGF